MTISFNNLIIKDIFNKIAEDFKWIGTSKITVKDEVYSMIIYTKPDISIRSNIDVAISKCGLSIQIIVNSSILNIRHWISMPIDIKEPNYTSLKQHIKDTIKSLYIDIIKDLNKQVTKVQNEYFDMCKQLGV